MSRSGWLGGGKEGELSLDFAQELLLRGTPQAVRADFDKTLRQQVLEESLDELLGRQCKVSHLLRLVVAIAKSHLSIFKLFQPAVGDGDPEDISGQVVEDLISGASVPTVDVPVLIPARAARV